MSSIEPNDRCSQINGAEEVAGGFVIAGCNCPVLFEASEEVFDQMPCFL
jgi:hypothetical protein